MPPSLRSAVEGLIVASVLVGFAATELGSIQHKSLTFDEISHLTAGYSYWTIGDYRLQPENGVFPQRWVAIPLLGLELKFPSRQQRAWWNSELFEFSEQFFHELGNDSSRMLWRGRFMSVLLAVGLGGIVFWWARSLHGFSGGCVALLLFVFSPTVLAHGRLATSDMAIALGFTAWLAVLWRALHRLTLLNLLLSGLALGLALAAKMSGVLALPLLVLICSVRVGLGRPLVVRLTKTTVWRLRQRSAQALACLGLVSGQLLIAAVLVWALFGFRYRVFQEYEPGRDTLDWLGRTSSLESQRAYESERWPVGGLPGTIVHLARQYRVLPEGYLYGLAFTLATVEGHEEDGFAFLRGRHSQRGWWWFFPFCFLVKTPLGILACLGLAAGAGRARLRELRGRGWPGWRVWYRTLPLWLFLIAYWLAALTSTFNLGQRHLLPTYPVLFILGGGAAFWLRKRTRWAAVGVVLALGWAAVSTGGSYPHFLAYFNPLVGGPQQGYRNLVDSSLDWGQDLPGLKAWLTRETSGETVYLSYFGTDKPSRFGIEAQQLPSLFGWQVEDTAELRAGIYCISATMLQCVYPHAPIGRWTETYEQLYQTTRTQVLYFQSRELASADAVQALDEGERQRWNQVRQQFHALRFARLCSFLRQREADDQVGYSILIYRLSGNDIRQALHGPPLERVPDQRREMPTPNQ